MRLPLVRRLGARRPAVLGEDRERPDPVDAVQRGNQRHHADGLAPPRIRRTAPRTIDAFDRLYAESRESTRILAIGVHPYVTGAAHRIRYFEELYDYINAREGVLHWTGQQIYDWYSAQVPKPKL